MWNGDVLTLIEQAQRTIYWWKETRKARKIQKNKDFDLNDYLAQMKQVKN